MHLVKALSILFVSGLNGCSFLSYSQIENVYLMSDRNYAFVTFYRLEDAIQAKNALAGRQLHGSNIVVNFGTNRSRRELFARFRFRCEVVLASQLHSRIEALLYGFV